MVNSSSPFAAAISFEKLSRIPSRMPSLLFSASVLKKFLTVSPLSAPPVCFRSSCTIWDLSVELKVGAFRITGNLGSFLKMPERLRRVLEVLSRVEVFTAAVYLVSNVSALDYNVTHRKCSLDGKIHQKNAPKHLHMSHLGQTKPLAASSLVPCSLGHRSERVETRTKLGWTYILRPMELPLIWSVSKAWLKKKLNSTVGSNCTHVAWLIYFCSRQMASGLGPKVTSLLHRVKCAEEICICGEVIQMTPPCSLPLRGQCLGRCSLSLPELPRGCLFLPLFRPFYFDTLNMIWYVRFFPQKL